jgi:serine/threonine-protein kinase
MLREAQAAARLTSQHVVRVLDVGVTKDGHPYVVMEKLAGRDLNRELARRGSFTVADATDLMLQACEALGEAHASNLVHRDLKPSNLFLTVGPDGLPCVKVLDFGLVHSTRKTAQTDRRAAGSPGYASPEQLGTKGDVDERADVWGLGIVLYELVTGRRPFEASTLSAGLFEVVTKPLPPMNSPSGPLPPAFEAIVRKCLEKDREHRFANVREIASALGPFASPAFATYVRRVHEIGLSAGPASETMRMRIAPEALPGSGQTDSSGPGGSIEPNHTRSEVSLLPPSPLVVAEIVSPRKVRTRLVLVVLGIAAVVAIALPRPRSTATAAAPSTVTAGTATTATAAGLPSGVALLPPQGAASSETKEPQTKEPPRETRETARETKETARETKETARETKETKAAPKPPAITKPRTSGTHAAPAKPAPAKPAASTVDPTTYR